MPRQAAPQDEAGLAEFEERRVARENRDRNERLVELWAASGAPERHRGAKLDDLAKHQSWKHAWDNSLKILGGGGSVMLCGRRGGGKTQLGVEAIRHFCRLGQTAKYARCREIGMSLREAYAPNARITERQAIAAFTKPRLLVIDEVQERFDTDYERRSFTYMMDG